MSIFFQTLLEGRAMEEIVKILMSGSLTFIGLIFTSLGIILALQDNWKTKTLRKSDEFNAFLAQNIWCVVASIIILVLSILFLFIKESKLYPLLIPYIFGAILLCTTFVCYYVIRIAISYKQLIKLKSDDTVSSFSIESRAEEDD